MDSDDPDFSVPLGAAVLDLIPVAVYACRVDGTVAWYNRPALELWGRAPDPEDTTWSLRDGAPGEAMVVRPDGSRRAVFVHVSPLRDASGALVATVYALQDITDRRGAEEALRASEDRHRLLIESIRDHAVFTTDPKGLITSWNADAQVIFGYESGEIIGRACSILFTPEDRAAGAHEAELATAAREGRASDDRWQLRKGEARFWASGVTSSMRDAAGVLRGFIKVLRDLTPMKLMDEQRERLLERERLARQEAERTATMRDEFLSVVSHELRTPLATMMIWAKVLRAGPMNESEQERALDAIEKSAVAQQQLIEDLLDVSRMVSGKLRLSVRDVALAPPLRAAVEAVRPMADARGVVVDTVLDEDLLRARVDPDRIQQIVWNLVTNAVKFTGRGGRVAVALARHGDAAVLRVVDTGRGIRADFLPHIFERFRQADASTTREHGGLGLGLAITRQLVELHGGTIRAESPGEGGGAAFVVELPLAVGREDTADEVRAGATEGVDARAGAAPTLAGLRVLLIEDDDGTRDAIRWTLERAGAEVTALKSPVRALETFRERLGGQRFDVLVSDIGMPELDGYALLREVRDIERERDLVATTPALAVTAYARPEDRERALAAGFDEHVSKPVEPQRLVNLVAALAGRDEAPRG